MRVPNCLAGIVLQFLCRYMIIEYFDTQGSSQLRSLFLLEGHDYFCRYTRSPEGPNRNDDLDRMPCTLSKSK